MENNIGYRRIIYTNNRGKPTEVIYVTTEEAKRWTEERIKELYIAQRKAKEKNQKFQNKYQSFKKHLGIFYSTSIIFNLLLIILGFTNTTGFTKTFITIAGLNIILSISAKIIKTFENAIYANEQDILKETLTYYQENLEDIEKELTQEKEKTNSNQKEKYNYTYNPNLSVQTVNHTQNKSSSYKLNKRLTNTKNTL